MASVIEIHRQNEALIARLESMSAAELAALKADSVGIYLQAMWSMPTFDARDGTLDGAVASGKLGLIRDSQLRDRLVEWKARVEDSTEEAGELRAAAGRVLGRMTELGGPWGGDTPGIGPAFTNPDLADMMRHFPSGSLTLAVNDAELMGAVREKRLRAVMYLAALLGLSDQAN